MDIFDTAMTSVDSLVALPVTCVFPPETLCERSPVGAVSTLGVECGGNLVDPLLLNREEFGETRKRHDEGRQTNANTVGGFERAMPRKGTVLSLVRGKSPDQTIPGDGSDGQTEEVSLRLPGPLHSSSRPPWLLLTSDNSPFVGRPRQEYMHHPSPRRTPISLFSLQATIITTLWEPATAA